MTVRHYSLTVNLLLGTDRPLDPFERKRLRKLLIDYLNRNWKLDQAIASAAINGPLRITGPLQVRRPLS